MSRNPLANWRWWASLPLAVVVGALLVLLSAARGVCSAIADSADEVIGLIHVHTVRQTVRWVWGNARDGAE